MNSDITVRICAFAMAAIVVVGAIAGLGSYSNAKNAAAIAAATGTREAAPTQTAVVPVRIDVVGKRALRGAA